jgi:hypothetical protein
MKHLYAGFIIGGVCAATVLTVVFWWWVLGLFISSELATILTAIVIAVVAGVTVIDYLTEKSA